MFWYVSFTAYGMLFVQPFYSDILSGYKLLKQNEHYKHFFMYQLHGHYSVAQGNLFALVTPCRHTETHGIAINHGFEETFSQESVLYLNWLHSHSPESLALCEHVSKSCGAALSVCSILSTLLSDISSWKRRKSPALFDYSLCQRNASGVRLV